MDTLRAFIGLGSNLDEPETQVRSACGEIAALPGVRLRCCSSLYRTAPVGYPDQPDFINAVAEVRTSLTPEQLLSGLRRIEQAHRRLRLLRNGPRTLDLDLLIYADVQQSADALTLPHPRTHERAFVLLPLLEIAPDAVIPGRGAAAAWLPSCSDQGICRIDFPPQPGQCSALSGFA